MPTSFKRFALLLLSLVLIVLAWWGFVSLGHILHHEDPLEKADVIFVLAGARLERVAEGGELILAGWAPKMLLSRQLSDGAEVALRQRGIDFPAQEDFQRSVLLKMGVPEHAVGIIDEEQVTTASEGDRLLALATANQWSRVIVVTAKLHTARAGLAMRRRFEGTGVRVIMRGSRYDHSNVDRWWESRADLRFTLIEAQKMLAYWVGAAD